MVNIVNIAMDGTEQAYTMPDDVFSVTVQAAGGNIIMRNESGGSDWNIPNGGKDSFNARTIIGETLYFEGDAPAQVQLLILEGLGY